MKELVNNRVDLTQFELQDDICLAPAAIAGIAAGVSALSGVASTAINAGAKWGSSTYMRVAKEMADYNQSLNEAMYNKYQSPSALMLQYKEAGLNPYLVYGNAQPSGPAAGEVSTNPQDYVSDKGSVVGSALSEVGNSIARYQEVLSKDQALTNARVTEENIKADTESKNLANTYQEFKNLHQAELYDLDKRMKSIEIEQRALDLEVDRKTKLDNKLAEIDERLSRTRKNDQETENLVEEKKLIKVNRRFVSQRIKNLQHDIIASDRSYNLDVLKFQWEKSQAAAAASWRRQVYEDSRSDKKWEHDYKDKELRFKEKQAIIHYMDNERDYRDNMIWKLKQWQDSHDPVKQFQRDIQSVSPIGVATKVAPAFIP